ncbi:KPN_01571 family protein [Salmonella enterica]|nr:KPN_01571 family protein [Salmonella enterica subsp. VII str. CFSAN000554]
MNPITWGVFTLLYLDAINDVMGVSSLTDLW